MHGKMAGQFLDKGDINSIIEILRMNQVLPKDNMQFNGALLQPSGTFVSGIDQPSSSRGLAVNMPSAQEVKKFELEDLKRKSTNGAKNIEEIDFGPYRRNRGAIIKTARELEQHQSHDYAAERQELAEELAGKVTDRTMGIIRHSIIAPVAMPAVNFCVDTLSGHLMSLGSKDPSEDFGVAAGDRDVKKSLFNKWLDKREEDKALKIAREAASNLSDDELKTRAEELMGRKYILFGEMVLSTEGKALVQEYQSRFKEEKFKRSIEAVSTELDLAPGGAILKHLVEKATGEKIGSPGEPTASIGSRLAAEKALKTGDKKLLTKDDSAIASPGAGKANSLDTTPHSARVKALDVGETKGVSTKKIIERTTGVKKDNPELIELNKRLIFEAQKQEQGVIIAGIGASKGVIFKDIDRIVKTYGGSPEEWVKKSSTASKNLDGRKIETHWIENLKTGERFEFKIKDNK
jgi:hypothetical protein